MLGHGTENLAAITVDVRAVRRGTLAKDLMEKTQKIEIFSEHHCSKVSSVIETFRVLNPKEKDHQACDRWPGAIVCFLELKLE